MNDYANRTKAGIEQNVLTVPTMQYVCYQMEDADIFALNVMLNLKASNHQPYDNNPRMIVPAIKYFRMRFGVGLKEAKDALECYEKSVKEATTKEATAWAATPVGKMEDKEEKVESLGALLRKKMEENAREDQKKAGRKDYNKNNTVFSSFADTVFSLIGRSNINDCSVETFTRLNDFYNNGNSAGFTAFHLQSASTL